NILAVLLYEAAFGSGTTLASIFCYAAFTGELFYFLARSFIVSEASASAAAKKRTPTACG
ncbi:MAG: hypothetical protein CMJ64_08530, partial [Planctomycetaceae bacterium]|nr:hypothetical protein [Planctomycetaceae bacterium]